MVGRVEERNGLEAAYRTEESEFVAVYGRRRVGKTFLIRNAYANSVQSEVTLDDLFRP